MQPKTGYARIGDDRIAYQVIGDGPIDVILGPGTRGAMDMEWERPEWALFYRRWSSFCRVIRFDPRGAGASDPVPSDALPPWERAVNELIAVMDACESERAVPLGFLDGGPAAMLFAATMPDRTVGLILNHTAARHVAADDYPIGMPPAAVDEVVDRVVGAWGTGDAAWAFFPSQARRRAVPPLVREVLTGGGDAARRRRGRARDVRGRLTEPARGHPRPDPDPSPHRLRVHSARARASPRRADPRLEAGRAPRFRCRADLGGPGFLPRGDAGVPHRDRAHLGARPPGHAHHGDGAVHRHRPVGGAGRAGR